MMSDEDRTILDLTYADYDGLKLGMDLYLPPPQNTPFPTIMYIPVGGWRASKRVDLRHQFAAHDFTQHGFALAVIDCRVTPDVIAPATVFDCKAGIRWLRAHAAEYGLDADKIGTCGRSAGGHLSALLAVSGDRPELEGDGGNAGFSTIVQAAVDQCGPSDLERMADPDLAAKHPMLQQVTDNFLGGATAEHRDLARLVSPLRHVSADCPPMLILHGEIDPTVPLEESLIFHEALTAVGVDSTLNVLPGIEHGWDWDLTHDRIVEFFERTVKA
jgi:acetyl esterase/lipase